MIIPSYSCILALLILRGVEFRERVLRGRYAVVRYACVVDGVERMRAGAGYEQSSK